MSHVSSWPEGARGSEASGVGLAGMVPLAGGKDGSARRGSGAGSATGVRRMLRVTMPNRERAEDGGATGAGGAWSGVGPGSGYMVPDLWVDVGRGMAAGGA